MKDLDINLAKKIVREGTYKASSLIGQQLDRVWCELNNVPTEEIDVHFDIDSNDNYVQALVWLSNVEELIDHMTDNYERIEMIEQIRKEHIEEI